MIKEIKEYAIINDVPIIQDEGLNFILKQIDKYNVKNILEVGSAIGYSSIKMANFKKDLKITTLELDTRRYHQAIENIKALNLHDRIKVINIDGNDFKSDEKFDFIFLDGPKSQYSNMLENLYHNLNKGGIIVVDNLVFYGLVFQDKPKVSRRTRQLVEKIKIFREEILKDSRFNVVLYDDIGDGMGILIKKGDS